MKAKILKFIRHFVIVVRKYEMYVHKSDTPCDYNIELIMINDDNSSLLDSLSDEVSESKIYALKQRIHDEGVNVFVIKSEKKTCAGYCCLSTKDTYDSVQRKTVEVSEGSYYFFDDYVKKKYRGMKVHYGSIKERIQIASNRGGTRCIVCIANYNKASLHNYESCGFQLAEKIVAIKFIKKQLS